VVDPDDPGGRRSEARNRVWSSTEGHVLRDGETPDFRGPWRSKPINTARGTPWDLADLRPCPAVGEAKGRHIRLRHASLPRGKRGPWVRAPLFAPTASTWLRPDPWRPARPRFSPGRRLSCCSPGGGQAERQNDRPIRGLAKQYGRWRLSCACPAISASYLFFCIGAGDGAVVWRPHLCPVCNSFRTFKPYPLMTPAVPRFGHTIQRHRGCPGRGIASK